MLTNIPADLDFSLLPEWYPHSATQLHWPSNRQTWPGKRLKKVEHIYLDIIEVLHNYEAIHLFVENKKVHKDVLFLLEERGIDLNQIVFHIQAINDVWARDCGPLFVCREDNGDIDYAIVDWEYNSWGEKYPPYDADNKLPDYIAFKYGITRFNPDMVLEGGAIETNGDGVLLTTESVLLNPNRNPQMTKGEIEKRLKDYLGIRKVIWLKGGLAGDDTDGHVDDVARFLNENTILAMRADSADDINHQVLDENLKILHKATGRLGYSFAIETLPMPQTRIEGATVDGSTHVPASYTNFYIANGVVLVPLYDKRYDREAMRLFRQYFPDRDIVGIPCADLVWGQGAIHCITQPWYGL
ncbi:agmatine deiminase family protein [Fodinibius halophilus]|uniref:Agmatine deiminase family protein n=1 Tax=Fodinibius halophilus TaxID=1736908 RepID=A0A6M1T313_9BACT|nr:agmatine deiminase family protein [Fodinibius halophilus]NGP87003.1 agmatine deiminase family protein [Fodinibius halophilus]